MSLSRLRTPLLIAAFVLTVIVLLDVCLDVSLGARPDWLAPAFSSDILDLCGKRAAEAEELKAEGKLDDKNLIAMLGLSPVREGVDPQTLNASDPLARKWLVFGAEGRTLTTLEVYSRPLLDSVVHPAVVVLGISPAMLHHDDSGAIFDAWPRELPHHLRHLQLHHALLDASWLLRNRDSLADSTTLLIFDLTHRTRQEFGLAMSASYAPEDDPWVTWSTANRMTDDPALVDLQWRGHQSVLVESQFRDVKRQSDALARIVAGFRAKGARVELVLMPETKRLRDYPPPIVQKQFDQSVQIASAGAPLNVIDMRDAIPDGLFLNDVHLNLAGRRQFSEMLPALVQ